VRCSDRKFLTTRCETASQRLCRPPCKLNLNPAAPEHCDHERPRRLAVELDPDYVAVASRAIGSANEIARPSGSIQTASRIPSFGCSVGGITKRAPRSHNSV